MPKKLCRSKTNRMIAGICGGIGEYLDVDPTFIRLIAVIIIICTGLVPGIIAYFIAALIIPNQEKTS